MDNYSKYREQFFKEYTEAGLLPHLYDSVEDAKGIDSKSLILINIDREFVDKGRIQPIIKNIEHIERKGSLSRSNVAFMFDGFNEDRREIYEIKEIRNWVYRLLKIKPHLFYYLTPHLENNLFIIYSCLVNIKHVGENVPSSNHTLGLRKDVWVENNQALIQKLTSSALAYAKSLKDSTEEQFKLANRLYESLHLKI